MGSTLSKEKGTATVHEIFGCVGCNRIPATPACSCGISGHSYCFGCATKFHFICVKLTDNLKHICGKKVKTELPKFLRTIFETAEFPCNYSAYGCDEILNSDLILPHERICPFKTFPCPYGPKCLWKGTILRKTFIPHLTEYHGVQVRRMDSLTMDVLVRRPVLPKDSNVCIWTEVVLEWRGIHFLLSFRYVKSLLCAWVWSFEPTFNKFFYTKICMISPNLEMPDEYRTCAWWGNVLPYELPVEEIVNQQGLCMKLEKPESIAYEDPANKERLPWWRLRVELYCHELKIDYEEDISFGRNKQSYKEDVKAAVRQCFPGEQSDRDSMEVIDNNEEESIGLVEVEGWNEEKVSSEMNKADVKVFLPANESNGAIEKVSNNNTVLKKEKGRGINKGSFLGEEDNINSDGQNKKNFYQKVKLDMKEKVNNRKSRNQKSQAKSNKKGHK